MGGTLLTQQRMAGSWTDLSFHRFKLSKPPTEKQDVVNSPYRDLPRGKFLKHLALPCFMFLFIGFLGVGVAANSPYFQEASGPSAVPTFWEAAGNVYKVTASRIGNLPSFCVFGEKSNDFQQTQCDRFWEDLLRTGALALAPFLLMGLVAFLNLEILSGFYLRMAKKVEKEKATLGGKVTQPPEAPEDFFSWYYCLQPVTVELANKNQIKVYLSSMRPVPIAGETLALFDAGTHMGQKRFVGVVYAPHIAVVRGA